MGRIADRRVNLREGANPIIDTRCFQGQVLRHASTVAMSLYCDSRGIWYAVIFLARDAQNPFSRQPSRFRIPLFRMRARMGRFLDQMKAFHHARFVLGMDRGAAPTVRQDVRDTFIIGDQKVTSRRAHK